MSLFGLDQDISLESIAGAEKQDSGVEVYRCEVVTMPFEFLDFLGETGLRTDHIQSSAPGVGTLSEERERERES